MTLLAIELLFAIILEPIILPLALMSLDAVTDPIIFVFVLAICIADDGFGPVKPPIDSCSSWAIIACVVPSPLSPIIEPLYLNVPCEVIVFPSICPLALILPEAVILLLDITSLALN